MTETSPGKPGSLTDPRVDALWRAGSNEEPPAKLDAAILSAARREVGAGPQSIDARESIAARRRWWPLAAAATVAAIAVGVLQLTPPDQVTTNASNEKVISDMPVPQKSVAPEPPNSDATAKGDGSVDRAAPQQDRATSPAPSREGAAKERAPSVPSMPRAGTSGASSAAGTAPAPRSAATPAQAPASEEARVATPMPAAPATTPMISAPSRTVAVPAPPPMAATPMVTPSKEGAAPRRSEAPRAAENAGERDAATEKRLARASVRVPLPVAEWIALIRRLRDEGITEEAVKELAAFRAEHPDHEKLLPRDLAEWRPGK